MAFNPDRCPHGIAVKWNCEACLNGRKDPAVVGRVTNVTANGPDLKAVLERIEKLLERIAARLEKSNALPPQ